jgi:hypothetical protein
MGGEIERMKKEMDKKFVIRKKRRQEAEKDLVRKTRKKNVGQVTDKAAVGGSQEFDKRLRGS